MSVVLSFPQNIVSKRVQSAVFASAEIVIFPGVRVERRSSDLASALTTQRKRRVSQAALDEETLSLT